MYLLPWTLELALDTVVAPCLGVADARDVLPALEPAPVLAPAAEAAAPAPAPAAAVLAQVMWYQEPALFAYTENYIDWLNATRWWYFSLPIEIRRQAEPFLDTFTLHLIRGLDQCREFPGTCNRGRGVVFVRNESQTYDGHMAIVVLVS